MIEPTDPSILSASLRMVGDALSLGAEMQVPFYACHAGYRADADCPADGVFIDYIYPSEHGFFYCRICKRRSPR